MRATAVLIVALALFLSAGCGATHVPTGGGSPSASTLSPALGAQTPGTTVVPARSGVVGPAVKAGLGDPLTLTAADGVDIQATALALRRYRENDPRAAGLGWHTVVGVRMTLVNLSSRTYRQPESILISSFLLDDKGCVYSSPNSSPLDGLIQIVVGAHGSVTGWLYFQVRPATRAAALQFSVYAPDGRLGETGEWRLR